MFCPTVTTLHIGYWVPKSLRCEFQGRLHPQKQRKMKRASFKCFTWSIIVPWWGASVCKSKIYKGMKNWEDRKKHYPRPVISIGWAQVPSQEQLEAKHTQLYRENDREEGHFYWLGSYPSQAKSMCRHMYTNPAVSVSILVQSPSVWH